MKDGLMIGKWDEKEGVLRTHKLNEIEFDEIFTFYLEKCTLDKLYSMKSVLDEKLKYIEELIGYRKAELKHKEIKINE